MCVSKKEKKNTEILAKRWSPLAEQKSFYNKKFKMTKTKVYKIQERIFNPAL